MLEPKVGFLKTTLVEGRFASGELYLKCVFGRVPRNFHGCLPTASSKTRVKFCYYGHFHLDEIMKEEKQVLLSFIIGMDVVWNPRFLPEENRTFYILAVCSLWGWSMKEIIHPIYYSVVPDQDHMARVESSNLTWPFSFSMTQTLMEDTLDVS